MNVTVDADELSALREENKRLRAREQELLEKNTELVFELRRVDRSRMVREFHALSGQTIGYRPRFDDETLIRFRLSLIAEEFFELLVASFGYGPNLTVMIKHFEIYIESCALRIDALEFVDALADTEYVIEGTFIALGVDSTKVWQEVQRANLAKFPDGKVLRRADSKILKPEGWTPPDIEGVLVAQGWVKT